MHVEQEGPRRFKHMTECPFSKDILFRGVGAGCFMNNAMGVEEGGESGVDVVFGVVRAEATNGGRELSLNQGIKVGNDDREFRFVLQKIGPREAGRIVNKNSQPSGA